MDGRGHLFVGTVGQSMALLGNRELYGSSGAVQGSHIPSVGQASFIVDPSSVGELDFSGNARLYS